MSYPCAISIAGLSRPTAYLIVHSFLNSNSNLVLTVNFFYYNCLLGLLCIIYCVRLLCKPLVDVIIVSGITYELWTITMNTSPVERCIFTTKYPRHRLINCELRCHFVPTLTPRPVGLINKYLSNMQSKFSSLPHLSGCETYCVS